MSRFSTSPPALTLLVTLVFLSLPVQSTQAALILDIAFDSLELNGGVTTDLLGPSQFIHWTNEGSDDCFLTVDADLLKTMGSILLDDGGAEMNGKAIIRGGLQVAEATGTTVFTDGWHFLQHFDSNRDGLVGAADPIWNTLDLFMDADANGRMVHQELHRPETVLSAVETGGGDPYDDANGNTRSDALFTDLAGVTGVMSDVQFSLLASSAPESDLVRAGRPLRVVPNPFNPRTTVQFELAADTQLQLVVYDAQGQKIKTLTQGYFGAGSHSTVWSGINDAGRAVASGIYFVRLETPAETTSWKMTLVR